MKILYITPSFQHPTVRGPHRHYYFIRELSRRHDITLLTLARHPIGDDALAEMTSYTRALFAFDVNGGSHSDFAKQIGKLPVVGGPLKAQTIFRNGLRQMKAAFGDLVKTRPFDVVLFHGKSVFPVIEDFEGLPLVVDFCDATSMRLRTEMRYAGPLRRPWLFWRLQQVRRTENRLINKTPYLAFVSLRDRMATNGETPNSRIIPIGVDSQYWKRTTPAFDRNRLIFTGVMDYGPNHDAAVYLIDTVLPLLRDKNPRLELWLVGRSPRPELQQKARQTPGVTVTGAVDDLRLFLERAALFVAPMRYASGTQNKLLEAMAMEVPVATTALAASGLHVEGGGEPPVIVADNENQLADKIINILENQELHARLASQGRAYVETHFNWTRSAETLETMCIDAASQKAITAARR
jgi:hypothetical protein